MECRIVASILHVLLASCIANGQYHDNGGYGVNREYHQHSYNTFVTALNGTQSVRRRRASGLDFGCCGAKIDNTR